MSSVIDKAVLSPIQLSEKLTMLNQSLKGILPTIKSRQVNDISKLTISSDALAWNGSKGFNY